ncbi:MAG: hypothetical protein HZB76_06480 [Chlamydiae bacterium]|nr:hypothetical protein [Chlamydiota bacterium]
MPLYASTVKPKVIGIEPCFIIIRDKKYDPEVIKAVSFIFRSQMDRANQSKQLTYSLDDVTIAAINGALTYAQPKVSTRLYLEAIFNDIWKRKYPVKSFSVKYNIEGSIQEIRITCSSFW